MFLAGLLLNTKSEPQVQVAATQSQEGQLQATGKVKIGPVAARPSIPCPPKGECPPCPELPGIELDFGAIAKGSQGQALTATASAGNKRDFGVHIGMGSTIGQNPVIYPGIMLNYNDISAKVEYRLDGLWQGGVYWRCF